MGEALYRKHRPQRLADVVGQPHITQTLERALKKGMVSHGYLFSGPRGVGKTSIARILAYEVNGLAYADTKGSLDIIEIDAASNRRIDEIREIRDKVHTAPVMGKYKVYIIDEVHMLTREAFNALLKTLEEPPAHVIFILATTEVHKVPETIVSRTQRFAFKPITVDDVAAHLRQLATHENIAISDEAIELIAKHGEGSFRDSISLLDQLAIGGTISIESVQSALGIPTEETITSIIEAMQTGNLQALISILDRAEHHGYYATQIAKSLIAYLRQEIINNNFIFGADTTRLMSTLLQTPNAPYPRDFLELSLIEYGIKNIDATLITEPKASSTKKDKDSTTKKATPIEKKPQKTPSKPASTAAVNTKATSSGTISPDDWEAVLAALKKTNNTLYGIARMAKPEIVGQEITLKVPFKFHHRRLTDEKNGLILRTVLDKTLGNQPVITVVVDESLAAKPKGHIPKNTPQTSDTLESITQIFGGGEVLDT